MNIGSRRQRTIEAGQFLSAQEDPEDGYDEGRTPCRASQSTYQCFWAMAPKESGTQIGRYLPRKGGPPMEGI
ncbi:hypothetical protein BM221_004258 [Beauveria bassiana]|uniref:Uncharacterized protein n=1 Tax=Beauveria bassiana TaxID=176275 RepID=A0A2N6NQR8_BEABA|nr:hypothetical protein BM221_004258 [Beauveria bassiana]